MSDFPEPILLVPEHRRYEMNVAGQVAFVNYRREGKIIALTHAEVPAALNGRGIGSALVRGTLEQIKAAGDQVRPVCPFIAAFMDRHPEYDALRAEAKG
jgi:predicted GNAT family acetyltransferase